MASVSVVLEGNVIRATYVGAMTMEVVKEGERQIEAMIGRVPSPSVLYDTRAMDAPPVALALEMKNFDSRIAKKITRSVFASPMTALMSGIVIGRLPARDSLSAVATRWRAAAKLRSMRKP